MIVEKHLPFARGKTYSDARHGAEALVTLSDTAPGKNLEGRLYQVADTIHKTNHLITLRVVKNDSGGALPVKRNFLSFSTSSKSDFGCRADGTAATAGEVCKPMDDAYYYGTEGTGSSRVETTIAQYDLFYVVEEGPCRVECTGSGTAMVAGESVQMCGKGLGGPAHTGDAVVAHTLEAGSTAAKTATLLYVESGIHTVRGEY